MATNQPQRESFSVPVAPRTTTLLVCSSHLPQLEETIDLVMSDLEHLNAPKRCIVDTVC